MDFSHYRSVMMKSPGGGRGNPLQYSCLENSMDRRNLVGNSPWGLKQSGTTERLGTTAEHDEKGGHNFELPWKARLSVVNRNHGDNSVP